MIDTHQETSNNETVGKFQNETSATKPSSSVKVGDLANSKLKKQSENFQFITNLRAKSLQVIPSPMDNAMNVFQESKSHFRTPLVEICDENEAVISNIFDIDNLSDFSVRLSEIPTENSFPDDYNFRKNELIIPKDAKDHIYVNCPKCQSNTKAIAVSICNKKSF